MMTWRALAVLMVILVSVITFATIGMSRVCSNVYLRTEQYTESSSNKETNNPNSTRDSPLSDRKRTIKQILTDYNKHSLDQLQRLISRNATSRDAEVISLVRDLMDPPSNHMVKNVRHIVSTPQSKEVLTLLDNKQNGFFIEVGALDGERSSNTLELESRHGWTGLLIEMDPYYYTQLRARSRRSWSIHACVSPYDHPSVMEFKEDSGGQGKLLESKKPSRTKRSTEMVPCFPLESMLLALNTTHVDYWSLDVEGFELDILRTVPFDRLDISVLSVEYAHGRSGKEAYKEFMEGKGYRVHKDIKMSRPEITLYVADYIFVKD